MVKKRQTGAWCIAVAMLTTAGCGSQPPTNGADPTANVVGSIDIETRAPHTPGPTLGPTGGPGLTPNPEPDPTATGAPLHDDHEHASPEEVQALYEDFCPRVAQWWSSAGETSLTLWREEATGQYASNFILDGYTERTYEALSDANWDGFDTTALALPADGFGACIFSRPEGENRDVETVTFTYRNPDPPLPGTMIYERSGSMDEAKRAAEDAVQR
jgi:hypothetical protein